MLGAVQDTRSGMSEVQANIQHHLTFLVNFIPAKSINMSMKVPQLYDP